MTSADSPYSGPTLDLTERYRQTTTPLLRLTYVSRRVPDVGEDDLINIMLSAAVRNYLTGISGELWVSSRHFAQTLEGAAASIEAVYRRICADRRHAQVTCIARARAKGRGFNRPLNWTRVAAQRWGALDIPVIDPTLSFDDACDQLIGRGPISPG